MSTQCGIAIKEENTYKTIYVHADGYISYMWPMLTEHYNSEELAKKLVSLGDASYIEEKLEPEGAHSFDKPEEHVCVFYHRDRGEYWNDVAPAHFMTKGMIFNRFYYAYIWEDGRWTAYKGGRVAYI
jgi:hypothetical protein